MSGYQSLNRPRPTFNQRPAVPIVPRERVDPKPRFVFIEEITPLDVLRDMEVSGPKSMKVVLDAVLDEFKVHSRDVMGLRRDNEIIPARQCLMWLLKQTTHHSYPRIGRFVGGRDHTTAMHAVRAFSKKMEANPDLKARAERALSRVMGH